MGIVPRKEPPPSGARQLLGIHYAERDEARKITVMGLYSDIILKKSVNHLKSSVTLLPA